MTTRIMSGELKEDVVIKMPGHVHTIGAGRVVTIIIVAEATPQAPRKECEDD